jgi:hypothetical protein
MKQFTIILSWKDSEDKFKCKFSETLESDSLLELLAKFQFSLFRLTEEIKIEEIMKIRFPKGEDDDIPF